MGSKSAPAPLVLQFVEGVLGIGPVPVELPQTDNRVVGIGYGGGFFDRTLAELKPAPLRVGDCFELARVDTIRREAHDVRLDAMVSEAGVFRHV